MRMTNGVPVIPSVPTDFETIQASLTEVLEKVAELPLTELVTSLANTAESLERLTGSGETRQLVTDLSQTLASLRTTLEALNRQADPLISNLTTASSAAGGALRQAQETFAALQRSLGPTSPLSSDVQRVMDELAGAARSIRGLADYLQRHPEALLRGKSGGYQ
jgi:paraquat-inducible protein B